MPTEDKHKVVFVSIEGYIDNMSDAAHISRNGDGSLEHRVREYLEAQDAYENVKLSRQLVNDPKWADTLGDQHDIISAEQILKQSLSLTTSNISEQDLELAQSRGILSDDQVQIFSKTKVQMEFEAQTNKTGASQADRSGQRQ